MRLLLILFLLVSLQTARAQEAATPAPAPAPPASEPPLIKAPAEPEPEAPPAPPPLVTDVPTTGFALVLNQGERVRVQTARGESQSGELMSLMPGALSLKASPEQVVSFLLADVQRLETRKRAPVHGALIGGGSGALAGGVLMALLCIAIAEGGDSDAGACALFGGLFGGGFGAGVGALVGLAVPRWSTVYDKEEQGPLSLRLKEADEGGVSHWFSGRGPVGEVGFQLGYGRDLGIARPTQGWGGRLHLLALLGPYVAVGPEVAWYSNIGTETVVSPFTPPFRNEHHLFQLGGLLRGGAEIGPTRTAVLVGLGLHDNRTGHVGVSLGGEVELDLGEHVPPLAVDVRYHFPLDRNEFEPVEKFLTFDLGTRLRW